jgi:hypothetical protein
MNVYCASCGSPIENKTYGTHRKYCSEKCLKQKKYNQYKSVYKASGMGEAGPAGIYEGEQVSDLYACSYDEHYVDPAILAQAELMESSQSYAFEIMRSKNNGIRLRRGGNNWSKPVSVNALNKFK